MQGKTRLDCLIVVVGSEGTSFPGPAKLKVNRQRTQVALAPEQTLAQLCCWAHETHETHGVKAYDQLDMSRTVIGTAQGSGNGRSRILGAEGNLVRLYVDRDTGVLLGGVLVALKGEHLAHALAWAVQRGDTVEALLALPYYHPPALRKCSSRR